MLCLAVVVLCPTLESDHLQDVLLLQVFVGHKKNTFLSIYMWQCVRDLQLLPSKPLFITASKRGFALAAAWITANISEPMIARLAMTF